MKLNKIYSSRDHNIDECYEVLKMPICEVSREVYMEWLKVEDHLSQLGDEVEK